VPQQKGYCCQLLHLYQCCCHHWLLLPQQLLQLPVLQAIARPLWQQHLQAAAVCCCWECCQALAMVGAAASATSAGCLQLLAWCCCLMLHSRHCCAVWHQLCLEAAVAAAVAWGAPLLLVL
jgi:hypothetical protein